MLWHMEQAAEAMAFYRDFIIAAPDDLNGFFAFLTVPPAAPFPVHVQYGSQLPSMLSTMHLYPIDGAAQRVGKNDTAFSYRDARWAEVIVGVDPDPANQAAISSWCKDYWQALHPYSAGGAYINMMMDEGQERVQASYRDNYARLAEIKAIYDPHNLFRVNQNIQPANQKRVNQ